MAHLIDNDALVAEIENKINKIDLNSIEDWRYRLQREHDIEVIKNIISIINTFEVKEVDLEKEIDKWYNNEASKEFENVLYQDIEKCAKYFFELGLKV